MNKYIWAFLVAIICIDIVTFHEYKKVVEANRQLTSEIAKNEERYQYFFETIIENLTLNKELRSEE